MDRTFRPQGLPLPGNWLLDAPWNQIWDGCSGSSLDAGAGNVKLMSRLLLCLGAGSPGSLGSLELLTDV
jgi:hypothetical protein